jgi:S1/P1 Nuclease
MKASYVAVLALALTGFSSEALAWGADGHRAVAAIALKLLPPDKAQAADNLLNNSDVGRGFVDAASYADEVIRERDHRHVFSPWHFVDWPADAATYSDSFCDPDCIVNELPKQIEAMRTSTDMEAKALAMSWVIHLMGDLHQPMHVTDRGDRGGNEFKVTYNGRTRCRESNSTGAEAKVELHSAWDSCLVFTLESDRDVRQARRRPARQPHHLQGAPGRVGDHDGLDEGDPPGGHRHRIRRLEQRRRHRRRLHWARAAGCAAATVERGNSLGKDHRREFLGEHYIRGGSGG